MAQKLYTVFQESLEKHFTDGRFPLQAVARKNAKNSKIRFVPVGNANDGTGNVPEYNIQRFRRTKEKPVDNTNFEKLGSDQIALLDSAVGITWDTVTTKKGVQRQLLIKTKKGEGTQVLADASARAGEVSTITMTKMISMEERGISELLAAGAANTVVATAASLKKAADASVDVNKLADLFTDVLNNVEELVDDFKYSVDVVTYINPRITKFFAQLQGQVYRLGTNTFDTQFRSGFQYAEHDYLPEDVLKSITDSTNRLILGICASTEAWADNGMDSNTIEVNEQLIRGDVVGHIYDEVHAVIDPLRIVPIAITLADAKTLGLVPANYAVQKKVND